MPSACYDWQERFAHKDYDIQQLTQLKNEIAESEMAIKGFRTQLEEFYKKQRDLVNQRAKLKTAFTEADLAATSLEMLKLLFR